ncbi:NAD(P)/FAD-dependent oxidoreductase, partial [Rhodococcus jostii]
PGAASAPPFGDNLSSEAAGTLQKPGIDVRPGAPVTDVDAHGPTVRDADRTEHRTESACKA